MLSSESTLSCAIATVQIIDYRLLAELHLILSLYHPLCSWHLELMLRQQIKEFRLLSATTHSRRHLTAVCALQRIAHRIPIMEAICGCFFRYGGVHRHFIHILMLMVLIDTLITLYSLITESNVLRYWLEFRESIGLRPPWILLHPS